MGRYALAAALLFGTIAGYTAAHAEKLRLAGTGAALGTMRLLADAYKKTDGKFSLEIIPNLGSDGAIKALERHAIQLATVGRALTADEIAQGFVASEYAKTPFVIAAARKDIRTLTLAQIADIYAGRQSRWPNGELIRLVLRPASDGDTALLASFSPGIKDAVRQAMTREGMVISVTDQESATEIARLKGGLGASSLALIESEQRPLYTVAINGVAPSVKNLSNGSYPYAKTLYFVTRGPETATVTRFIAFVHSKAGQRILNKMGNAPAHASISGAAVQ
jgi:phosphate transport system substrate-binding protein